MPREYIRIPIAGRLWPKVNKTAIHWLWTGATDRKGYGKIGVPTELPCKSKLLSVHRVAWGIADGKPIPPGLDVLHTCDIPLCVRNDERGTYEVDGKLLPRWGHLFLGTNAQNTHDMMAKGRDRMSGPRAPERVLRGIDHPMASLTEEQVVWIRSRVASGYSQAGVARSIGKSTALVCLIVNRKIWQHI